jgi:uncharacterized protein (TIGR02145 family)
MVRMNKSRDLIFSVCLIAGMVLIHSCKKDPSLAILKTNSITDVTINSLKSGGEITSSGGADITVRGVCWSTTQNPVVTDSHTSDGKGSGSFSSSVTGLTPDTKYYIRAYATNSAGTAYGNEVSSNTTALVVPVITTSAISDITYTSATSGGSITSDGGAPVTAKGICWSTSTGPTTSDRKTSDGTGIESFASYLTDLSPGTTYHVRSYAINSVGTAYGNELTFATTALGVPTVTTAEIGSITYTTAVSGGNISANGGSDVTLRGVCWSVSANPTINDGKSSDGAGNGSFISSLTNLLPGTLYHVRAYATNGVGTGYGSDITLTTTAIGFATITTKDITSISYFTAASGGDITDAGGGTITAKGVCWGLVSDPTIAGSHTSNGTGTANFASNLTGLSQNTQYHVRAYATNNAGTSYGNEVVFMTLAVAPATLTTTDVSLITATTAHSGGNISNSGGGNILARGICWSLTATPTINDFKTLNGTGIGSYASDMSGLQSDTQYHVRAYATNEYGTSYGNETTFSTLTVTLPVVTTTTVTSITASSASSGGNVTDAGNGTISARGVCWGTTTAPLVTGNHTSDATGTGSFTSNITGLAFNTKYYVRAYATNSAGTGYGTDEYSFTTPAATDADGNNYTSVAIGAQIFLVENLKTTRYNNGDLIGTTVPMNLDITTAVSPKYQWPCDGNEGNVPSSGRLYTWFVVTDSRGVCPTGWHVPTDAEWETMKTFLGGEGVTGTKIKEPGTAHWQAPNAFATNESGFTALGVGWRQPAGNFVSLKITAYFWSTTQGSSPELAYGQGLHWDDALLLRGGYTKNDGVSIRCEKD